MSRVLRKRDWYLLWLAISVAWLGVVVVATLGYAINARTLRDEAIRTAEANSAREAAVARCMASRPQLLAISRHVDGVNDLATILVKNSAALVDATPKWNPDYKVRLRNLRRIVRAREKVKAISSFPVPTKAECQDRGRSDG